MFKEFKEKKLEKIISLSRAMNIQIVVYSYNWVTLHPEKG